MSRKIEEKKIVKEVTKKNERVFCDLCGKEAMYGDWSGGVYEINETEIHVRIKQKEGCQFPEGGSGEYYEVDICPECFKEKLVPWLNSQGANLKPLDWSW